jgi:hypothetical protein
VGDGNFSTGLRLQLATLMDIFLPWIFLFCHRYVLTDWSDFDQYFISTSIDFLYTGKWSFSSI